MIEKLFDVPFVAALALREKQIQQNYRPIIAVHKWFARRPGTLFRSLILSEFGPGPLRETYYSANKLTGISIADPLMGGGTPLIEANRMGCNIIGYDINPLAYWIVRQEIEHLDLTAYRDAANKLTHSLAKIIGRFYRTACPQCGIQDAHVKYFLWVKTTICRQCGKSVDLFPGYLLAENQRHPNNVFICANCGDLSETKDRTNPRSCQWCAAPLARSGPARQGTCKCPDCGTSNTYPNPRTGAPTHRMFAIEYHCPRCKPMQQGRLFKKPDTHDLQRYDEAEATWRRLQPVFVPDDEIPAGDETDRLHRWGYRYYWQMFNPRQLLALELSCRAIAEQDDLRLRNALATNLSDLLRYQNMLCRYDTMALKSLDIFSVHGFPVGLVQCESNFLGIPNGGQGKNIGSGGWSNIIEKYVKAKAYCQKPFEVLHKGNTKIEVHIPGEWIGEQRQVNGQLEQRKVDLRCESATRADLEPASLDAVFTDPPYFGNVQYAELMDFCYVWLRRLVSDSSHAFQSRSTRNINELTGNVTMDRGLTQFTKGLSEVFSRMAKALKPGAPLAFTYHHNSLDAYYPVAVSILDAGLTCSASIPCPAEMGASIHINGTASSIIDTIFVCRSTGKVPRRWITETAQDVADLVREDIEHLLAGQVIPTQGDIRCIIFGHLVRLAIWRLRHSWDGASGVEGKLALVARQVANMGGLAGVECHLGDDFGTAPRFQWAIAKEESDMYSAGEHEVSF